MFINATGFYVPEERVDNQHFLELSGLTSEWIEQRTGIHTRSKAKEGENINTMSLEAVKDALPKLPYDITEVDLIVSASYSPYDTVATAAGANVRGCLTQKKNMFEIVAAHGIPYAATASIGYLNDFIRKVEHAATIRGTKYIHVMAPCPTGWGCDVDETVDISKDIVDCGLWYLAEFENGTFKLNRNPRQFASVEAYLRRQGRFKALTDEDIAEVEAGRDVKWEVMRRDWV